VKKVFTDWQNTDHNMAHAHSMLDIQVNKYTLRIINTYRTSTAKTVSRKHLSVTLNERCQSRSLYKAFISYLKNATQLIDILVTLLGYFIARCCKLENIHNFRP